MNETGAWTVSRARVSFVGLYTTLAGCALLTASAVAGLVWVALSSADNGAPVGSIVAGCGVSWIASCAGAIPIAWAVSSRTPQPINAILLATVVRFIAALLLVVPLTLSGRFARATMVACVGVSYLVTLLVDTLIAVQSLKRVYEKQ